MSLVEVLDNIFLWKVYKNVRISLTHGLCIMYEVHTT